VTSVPDGPQTGHSRDATERGSRLRSLDGLRGIAALVVVIHHAVQVAPAVDDALQGPVQVGSWSWLWTYTPLHIAWAGHGAVLVFFVLSGFVLALPTLGQGLQWTRYYPKRLLRLYLPVWVSLVVAAALVILVPRQPVAGRSDYLDDRSMAAVGDAPREALLLAPGWHLNGPLWSLRWELLFSLLLPMYVLLAKRFRTRPILSFTATFALLGTGQVTGEPSLIFLPVFALGVLLAFHQAQLRRVARSLAASRHSSLAWTASAGLTVVLLTAQWTLDGAPWSHPVLEAGASAAPFVGACLAVFLSLHWPWAVRCLQRRTLQWLGRCSFSLYLIHEPVIVTAAFIMPVDVSPLIIIVAVIPLSLAAGQAFYMCVERPSMGIAHRAGVAAVRFRDTSLPLARRAAPVTAGGENQSRP
jgi:peptidoglycan/LPS O-acetylase OafA/YrhL